MEILEIEMRDNLGFCSRNGYTHAYFRSVSDLLIPADFCHI